MASLRIYSRAITASCIFGVLLSVYAFYVEMALEAKPDYKAFCDISERMSCTKVLGSDYAKGFGIAEGKLGEIPNCVHGILFYLLVIFLATFDHKLAVWLQLLLCWLAVITSLYLAYILYFVLYDLCVVCVSIYVVNVVNLLMVRAKYAAILADSLKKEH